MRIGLLIYDQLEDQSGGYLYDRKLVEHLQAHGHQVEIISLRRRGYFRHLLDNWRPRLFQRLAGLELDLLLQDELNHPSLFALNRRLRWAVDYPIISIVHHLRVSEAHTLLVMPFYRAIERRYLNSVDGFIFNSATTQGVVSQYLQDEKPFVVAQPAGDRLRAELSDTAIKSRAQEPGPLRVAFVGALIPRKTPQVLLEALAMLPPDAVRARLIGSLEAEPGYVRFLRGLVRTLDIGDRVELSGHQDNEALEAALAESQVLALPSAYEGFGIVYLEGMSFGLPAIGTRAGAAGELISHGEDGYLIEPGDARTLAHYLEGLHQDRERLARMGLAARRRFEAQPGWEENMARARLFLEDLSSHLSPDSARRIE